MRNSNVPHTGASQGKSGALAPPGSSGSPRDIILAAEHERELRSSLRAGGRGADRHDGSGHPTLRLDAAPGGADRMHSPGVRVASSGSIPSPPKRESQQGSAQKTSSGSGDNATKGESARKKLSLRQVEVLEEVFQMDPAGVPDHRAALAREFGVAQQQIATWFQNRRARERNRQLVRDFEALRECLVATSNDNLRLRMEVEQLKAAHAQCKPRAGLAAKEEPAPFPAPERQPQPGQPPVFGGNEWIGRSYSPPDLKHKSMRVVSLLDPDSGSGPTAPSFRSPFDAFPAPPANADSYAATPFAPSSTYLSFRNEVFPPPASAPAFFPPAPEPKGDITLDEAFSGVLRHGSGMGSMEGLVFNEGAGFRAPPAPGMAVPASSAGVAGQPLGGGLAEWAGQAQEGGASAAAPTWDTGLRRGDAEDIWQGMERRLPAWYFRNQRG